MRSTSAVFSAIGAGPALMSATTTIARRIRNSTLSTTRRLTSTTRQAPRKNRRTGPGEDADMEGPNGSEARSLRECARHAPRRRGCPRRGLAILRAHAGDPGGDGPVLRPRPARLDRGAEALAAGERDPGAQRLRALLRAAVLAVSIRLEPAARASRRSGPARGLLHRRGRDRRPHDRGDDRASGPERSR